MAPTGFDNIPSQSKQYFPNTDVKVDIIGQAGHGLNLEYDHPTTYATMLNYLVQNGLAPSDNPSCNANGGNNGGNKGGNKGGKKGGHKNGGYMKGGKGKHHGAPKGYPEHHEGKGWGKHHGPPS